MATNIFINNVRSIQLSDVYPSEPAHKLQGAGECIRTLRVQCDDGEIRISLSGEVAEKLLLSYQKR